MIREEKASGVPTNAATDRLWFMVTKRGRRAIESSHEPHVRSAAFRLSWDPQEAKACTTNGSWAQSILFLRKGGSPTPEGSWSQGAMLESCGLSINRCEGAHVAVPILGLAARRPSQVESFAG